MLIKIRRFWSDEQKTIAAINNADNVHGDYYKYGKYKGADELWDIYCPIHGRFEQRYGVHIYQKCECPKCSIKIQHDKISYNFDYFMREFLKTKDQHITFKQEDYNGWRKPMKAQCIHPIHPHGEIHIYPDHYLNRHQRCRLCNNIKNGELINLKGKLSFFFKLKDRNPYFSDMDFSEFEYITDRTKSWVKCKVCGNRWKSSPNNLLGGHGCPECHKSTMERVIRNILEIRGLIKGIDFFQQYTFAECKNIRLLPFDFYFPKPNVCWEYDDLQHEKPVKFFGGEEEFRKRQRMDNIKNEYCVGKGKPILDRITYRDKKNIEEVVTKLLIKYKLI